MDSKHSRSTETSPSARFDNFRLIEGVNAEVESRLHQAGILTFAQFASLSPEDIITLVGNLSDVTVGEITRQNWIGQARELALHPTPDELQENETAPDTGEHHASFVTEMSLDAGNNLIQTRVVHVQTGEETSWSGWKEDQLVRFFMEHAGLHKAETAAETSVNREAEKPEAPSAIALSEPPSLEQAAVETPEGEIAAEPIRGAEISAEPSPASPATTEIATATQVSSEIVSKPRVSKLEIVSAESDHHSMLLRRDQPINVRVSLDLSDIPVRREEPLAYTAVVHARSLNNEHNKSFSRTSGKISFSENAVIKLSGIILGPGLYRLGADVTIHQPRAGSSPAPHIRVQPETALLRVY